MLKIRLLCFLFVLVGLSTRAQFNLGGQFSYLNGFDENNSGHAGGGIKLEYSAMPEFAVVGGFAFYSTAAYNTEYLAEAYNSATVPQTVVVDVRNDVSVMRFFLGAKQYVVGQHYTFKKYNGVNVYLEADFGVLVANYLSNAQVSSTVNAEIYEVNIADKNYGSTLDYNLSAGAGIEKKIAGFFMYAEVLGNVKLYQRSYTTIRLSMPFSFCANFGIRIPLGDEYL